MKIDKYFQQSRYNNKKYREIRKKVKVFFDKEYSGLGKQSSRLSHKQKKSVQF